MLWDHWQLKLTVCGSKTKCNLWILLHFIPINCCQCFEGATASALSLEGWSNHGKSGMDIEREEGLEPGPWVNQWEQGELCKEYWLFKGLFTTGRMLLLVCSGPPVLLFCSSDWSSYRVFQSSNITFLDISIILPLSKSHLIFSFKTRRFGDWTSSVDWTQMNRSYLKTETESSLWNVFWKINRATFR
jgi:hypothetical protein